MKDYYVYYGDAHTWAQKSGVVYTPQTNGGYRNLHFFPLSYLLILNRHGSLCRNPAISSGSNYKYKQGLDCVWCGAMRYARAWFINQSVRFRGETGVGNRDSTYYSSSFPSDKTGKLLNILNVVEVDCDPCKLDIDFTIEAAASLSPLSASYSFDAAIDLTMDFNYKVCLAQSISESVWHAITKRAVFVTLAGKIGARWKA